MIFLEENRLFLRSHNKKRLRKQNKNINFKGGHDKSYCIKIKSFCSSRHQDRIRDRERQRESRKASYPVYIKDFLKFSKKKKRQKTQWENEQNKATDTSRKKYPMSKKQEK